MYKLCLKQWSVTETIDCIVCECICCCGHDGRVYVFSATRIDCMCHAGVWRSVRDVPGSMLLTPRTPSTLSLDCGADDEFPPLTTGNSRQKGLFHHEG